MAGPVTAVNPGGLPAGGGELLGKPSSAERSLLPSRWAWSGERRQQTPVFLPETPTKRACHAQTPAEGPLTAEQFTGPSLALGPAASAFASPRPATSRHVGSSPPLRPDSRGTGIARPLNGNKKGRVSLFRQNCGCLVRGLMRGLNGSLKQGDTFLQMSRCHPPHPGAGGGRVVSWGRGLPPNTALPGAATRHMSGRTGQRDPDRETQTGRPGRSGTALSSVLGKPGCGCPTPLHIPSFGGGSKERPGSPSPWGAVT